MESTNYTAIVLAAGQGTRMKSPLPKVLHPVAGQPMIQYVLNSIANNNLREVRVVLGVGENLIRPLLEAQGYVCHRQKQQLGTADAVKQADPESIEGAVIILNGDHPLIAPEDIKSILKEFESSQSDVAVISTVVKNPGSYGRIVRHYDQVKAIVEAKDASQETLKIREINTGMYVVKSEVLNFYLPKIKNNNKQNEFYLTDLIAAAVEDRKKVIAISAPRNVAFGVNTQAELAQATKYVMRKKVKQLLQEGVIVIDPSTTYVEPSVQVGSGSVLYPGCFLKGKTIVESFCVIEPNVFIVDSKIQQSAQIRAGSYLEKAVVGKKSVVGPYARLRPGAVLSEEVQIGNFVELKNTQMAARSKAAHLTYLGDAEIGEDTNIGCGTITCNYAVDKKKYKTKIGKNVFVGSDTQFIAPIEIGDNAVIGSGSTITKDVPADALAVARGKQFVKENYVKKSGE
ncbi:bifunctional UDP-N-acetylglucosamine diphosphorylase/glucosamine-1-phosphate N-acetyltransferase GlmU [bacterium]|nr:bifunctional UDP-N-acetylglucosamine diphosphorylase/glucosamine-1-phosphate N-acetyltransferase GlmU [bacterium]